MLGRIDDSLRGRRRPGAVASGPERVPLVGAVVLIPMLASVVAQAFQARGADKRLLPRPPSPITRSRSWSSEMPRNPPPVSLAVSLPARRASTGCSRPRSPHAWPLRASRSGPAARTAWHSHPLGQT